MVNRALLADSFQLIWSSDHWLCISHCFYSNLYLSLLLPLSLSSLLLSLTSLSLSLSFHIYIYIYYMVINKDILIFLHIFNSNNVYLRGMDSCRLITTIIRRSMKPLVVDKRQCYKKIHYYHIIALLQILSTLQILPHLVCHQPTKWDRDDYTLLYIYIYIYI